MAESKQPSPPDLERGYTDEQVKRDWKIREDDDGSTFQGNPHERGGFADRPMGWER